MIKSDNSTTIQEASALLKGGSIVAFPTETVYGLGADAENDSAVQKIFKIKGRPSFNPLIVHVPDIDQAQSIGSVPDVALPLLEKYWPGPLTIVVPRLSSAKISPSVTAGLETIALRVPQHPTFRRLLESYGKPIAAPSANASNKLSCTTAAHVATSLGNSVPLIIESGTACSHGLESTIIDFSVPIPTLLRHGALPLEMIQACIGPVSLSSNLEKIKAPGQLRRHYAPEIPVRLNAKGSNLGEAYLNFGSPHPEETLNLSPKGNLEEAANNLFHMLHTLDDMKKFTAIAVAPIPQEGLGIAINDRLNRASCTLEKDTP